VRVSRILSNRGLDPTGTETEDETMGCDIHAFFEVKVGGNWMFYSPVKIARHYKLFSRLADVRNELPGHEEYVLPVAQPRGVPADASEMYRLHVGVEGEDGHSHSWISSLEFRDVHGEYGEMDENNRTYLFGNSFEHFYKYRDDYPDFVEDYRMCFFFDN
jgi:hypothetical protein